MNKSFCSPYKARAADEELVDVLTIGNPALNLGDVLRFSGGHADVTKMAAITAVTYKIGGRQTIKCVGKNPRFAKNLLSLGLISPSEFNKLTLINRETFSPYGR